MGDPHEFTARQRAARIAWLLARRGRLTVADIRRLTGLSRSGVYKLLAQLSTVLPIGQDEGRWQAWPDGELPAPEDGDRTRRWDR